MRTKEWRDALKQSLYFILFLAGMHLFMFLAGRLSPGSSFSADRVVAFNAISLIMFAMLMGLGTFAEERGQQALEYTLALPLSRARLLSAKFLPRFIIILCFIILFWALLAGLGQLPEGQTVVLLSMLLMQLFLVSFSLSLSSPNFVALFFAATIDSLLLALAAFATIAGAFHLKTGFLSGYPLPDLLKAVFWPPSLADYAPEMSRDGLAVLLPVTLTLPLPYLALRLSFNRFDPRPRSGFNRRLAIRAATLGLPVLLASFLLSYFLWQPIDFRDTHILTDDLHLIRTGFTSLTVYDQRGAWKPRLPIVWFPRFFTQSDGGWNYLTGYSRDEMLFLRLNPTLRRIEPIYSSDHTFYQNISEDGGHAYVLEQMPYRGKPVYSQTVRHGALRLVDIDLTTKRQTTLRFYNPRMGIWSPQISFTTVVEGKRNWFVRSFGNQHAILRLQEDGRAEIMASPDPGSDIRTLLRCGERAVCSTSRALHVGRLTADGFVSASRLPVDYNLMLYQEHDLQPANCRKVFAVRHEKVDQLRILAIDLDTLTVEDLGGDFEWRAAIRGDEAWFLRLRPENGGSRGHTVFHYREGKLTEAGRLPVGQILHISPAGVVIRRPDQKIAVYAFPDLRPLSFPGLTE